MSAIGISSILAHASTPLALAALVLLLGAPLLREILRRKGRSTKDSAAIIRYGFLLGGVFGVLAIASVLYSQSQFTEIRISGTVRGASGAGLAQVRVNVDGADSGVTDGDGRFAFTLPAARASSHYTVNFYREGFEPLAVKAEGRHPAALSVVLDKAALATGNIIALPPTLVVRHNLGVPSLELALTFNNPQATEITLTDIGVTLVSPEGNTVPMLMEGLSLMPGQFLQPLPMWKLEAGGSAHITYFYFNANPQFLALHQRVFAELAPHAAAITQPDPTARLLSDALVQDLRAYMQSQFIWTPGTWEIRAHARSAGLPLEARASFTLSEAAVARMAAIANYYPAALGVAPNWRFWETTDAGPVVVVGLGVVR